MLSLNDFFQDPDLVALISDRSIDFARSNTDPRVEEQRKEFLNRWLGDELSGVAEITQIHGKEIVVVDSPAEDSIPTEADGIITSQPGVPLTVRTADCLSVFIYDPNQKTIGLVHAGWRGTKEGVAAHAVELMAQRWNVKPQDLRCAFGPCLRSCCYKVGEEFQEYFPNEVIAKADGLYLDLPLANRRQLNELGVKDDNIFDCGICTHCDERFFSYRREGEKAGRMISLLMRK